MKHGAAKTFTTVAVFVDTNLLVYAYDRKAGQKHIIARQIVTEMWRSSPRPWISAQVLSELQAALVKRGLPLVQAARFSRGYATWRVVDNTAAVFLVAQKIQQRWQTALWDALILAATKKSGATEVLSEDMADGQDYGGVEVRNPFKP